jgi:hypothetical protein
MGVAVKVNQTRDMSTVKDRQKQVNIKLPISLLFSLRLLASARHTNLTGISLTTMREYATRLRIIEDRIRYGYEHTLYEQLAKVYLHARPYPYSQYILKDMARVKTKIGRFSFYAPAELIEQVKGVATSLFTFNDYMVQILAERMSRELEEDPTLLLRTSEQVSRQKIFEKYEFYKNRKYRTRDHFVKEIEGAVWGGSTNN